MNDDVAAREIAREQEFVDTVYRQLEDSARSAEELAAEGRARGQLGHEGGLVERDAMLFQAAKRIATLDAAHEGLVFGRLDMREEIEAQWLELEENCLSGLTETERLVLFDLLGKLRSTYTGTIENDDD